MYEGVVQLRPEDACSLAGKYEWQIVTGATSLVARAAGLAPLASFITADVHLMHSDAYDNAPLQSPMAPSVP
jgi:hypothetical protein